MSHEITLIENDVKSFQTPMEVEMGKSIKHFEGELVKVRSGRAHTSLVEDLPVCAYAQAAAPLKGLAAITAPEANLITIQPWDPSIIADIEKAIAASSIGLTPVNDGVVIRLTLPKMSSDRRDDLLKILNKKLEECRVALRNVRKDFNNIIRDSKKTKTISENFFNRLSDVLQKVTDAYVKKADELASKKEKDLTTI